jgi:hypothetical protein
MVLCESKGPEAIRGLTFMDARSHRPKSRPGFRPLGCRSQSLSGLEEKSQLQTMHSPRNNHS